MTAEGYLIVESQLGDENAMKALILLYDEIQQRSNKDKLKSNNNKLVSIAQRA